jgi:hypothetical protein
VVVAVCILIVLYFAFLAGSKQDAGIDMRNEYFQQYQTCREYQRKGDEVKIQGQVFNTQDQGVAGVSIFVDGVCRGSFLLSGNFTIYLNKGDYHIYVYHPDYAPYEQDIKIL